MTRTRLHRVKEAARLSGVSVRTLHHYDEIGLLVPSGRTSVGYRLYSDDDLLRLQQILIGRELGLPLEEIRRSLDDAGYDRKRALLEQRRQLEARARQTDAMLRAIDAAIAVIDSQSNEPGEAMSMRSIFEGFDPDLYEQEARERWGGTAEYAESKRRTSRYSPEDWQRARDEQAAVYTDAAAALAAGLPPEDPAVLAIAERHRLAIDRWFYPCGYAMHRSLAEMYEQDPRFAASIDAFGSGLTPYLAAAIQANAKRP